jgi:hypothetical protein
MHRILMLERKNHKLPPISTTKKINLDIYEFHLMKDVPQGFALTFILHKRVNMISRSFFNSN